MKGFSKWWHVTAVHSGGVVVVWGSGCQGLRDDHVKYLMTEGSKPKCTFRAV
jgi:hypothetical protein